MNSFKPYAMAALCLLAVPLPSFADVGTAGNADTAGAAGAQAPVESSFTLNELIALGLHSNRDLQTARYAVEIGSARLTQSAARANPRLEIGAGSDLLFGNEGEYNASIGISQDFPVTDRIARQKEVARVDLAIARQEVADAERRLAGEIAADVYRLLVVERQIQSRTELIALESSLARTTQARFKAAEVSELDVNAVQLDLQQQEQARRLLQSQRQSLLAALNTRLGRSARAPLSIEELLPETEAMPALEQLQAMALETRPDLRGTLLAADRADAAKALAKAERWGDWNAGVAVTQDQLVVDGAPPQSASQAIQFNLSIPLPLFSGNQGQIAEAEASRGQASSRAEAMRLSIASEISIAWNEASSMQHQLGQYRESLFPVSARSVKLAQKGYAEGLATMAEVLQAQRQQTDLNSAYLDTLDQFLQALVRLRTAVGDYPRAPASVDTEHKDS